MYEFSLDNSQQKKFTDWRKTQLEKDDFFPTIGERWEFRFTPTGLGTITTAYDKQTKEEIDLTDWDSF